MKGKSLIYTCLLILISVTLFVMDYIYSDEYEKVEESYIVYFNGEKLGLINNDQALYDYINKEQEEIRNTYNVDNVYPPNGIELMAVNTYDNNYTSVEDIYKEISDLDSFAIKGYIITLKGTEEEEPIKINVLNKEIFENAINTFVLAFIEEDALNNYLDGYRDITEIGSIINNMYFEEVITIKEGYINVDEQIFLDEESLSQYLLFGADIQTEEYIVQLGDTIDSISESHQLNPQELIVANPRYRDTKTLLKVGDKINVTLINPVVTLVYDMYEIQETVQNYTTKYTVDFTKDRNYEEVTMAGVNGLYLTQTLYQYVNGETSQEAKMTSVVIRDMIEEVVTVGRGTSISGQYVNISGNWGLPTNYPYIITSPFGWRSYKMHEGIDISGTGYNSPIYAVAAGIVVEADYRSSDGYYVIIEHLNNVYTHYAHMASFSVSVGDVVSRGDQIGKMGNTGTVRPMPTKSNPTAGTHLHFGVSIGWPYHGSYSYQNPRRYVNL